MSTIDNHSHKEKTAEQSGMEKEESVNSSPDQLVTVFDELSIKDRVIFVINVPVGVTPEMSTKEESHCQKFLDLLEKQAFRTDDDKDFYKDIAVVFGLNGKYEDEEIVKTELKKTVTSKITFKKWGFKLPEKKEMPYQLIREKEKEIPYRLIREKIKRSEYTKELVRDFRKNSPGVPIYFCFFDADTVHFNEVLSSYIDIIVEHKSAQEYPTVMSTGYQFPEDSEFRTDSERDRQVRIITAKHFPLGTYYPEPNFCVRLPDECDTLPECFTDTKSKQMNMESPVLIRQIKQRLGFSAVFADKNPIITPVSRQRHSHTKPRTWAISAYTHQEFKVTETYKQRKSGEEYKKDKRKANSLHVSLLIKILNSDEEAQRIEKENPFEGKGAGQVFEAAKAVRKYLNAEEPDEQEEQENLEEQVDPKEQEKELEELTEITLETD